MATREEAAQTFLDAAYGLAAGLNKGLEAGNASAEKLNAGAEAVRALVQAWEIVRPQNEVKPDIY